MRLLPRTLQCPNLVKLFVLQQFQGFLPLLFPDLCKINCNILTVIGKLPTLVFQPFFLFTGKPHQHNILENTVYFSFSAKILLPASHDFQCVLKFLFYCLFGRSEPHGFQAFFQISFCLCRDCHTSRSEMIAKEIDTLFKGHTCCFPLV